ncbi:hypothetical protein C1645_836492 [Glomus cerebriforme]|uniref:Uncharacterized protein n=1 Tax=Glomus cerebriforme TaxID=658196 RepID=A0A397S6X1_9GLOM|nr:hypothetical protein C1645_836492 [Glomus cerebriforme]
MSGRNSNDSFSIGLSVFSLILESENCSLSSLVWNEKGKWSLCFQSNTENSLSSSVQTGKRKCLILELKMYMKLENNFPSVQALGIRKHSWILFWV